MLLLSYNDYHSMIISLIDKSSKANNERIKISLALNRSVF